MVRTVAGTSPGGPGRANSPAHPVQLSRAPSGSCAERCPGGRGLDHTPQRWLYRQRNASARRCPAGQSGGHQGQCLSPVLARPGASPKGVQPVHLRPRSNAQPGVATSRRRPVCGRDDYVVASKRCSFTGVGFADEKPLSQIQRSTLSRSQHTFNPHPSVLNQSQGGMCICRVLGIGAGVRPLIAAVRQRRLTSSFRLDSPARNLPTRSCSPPAPQAQIASPLSRPAPDSLTGVEVRAVARQSLPSENVTTSGPVRVLRYSRFPTLVS